jgi:hypothetical protein
MWKFIKDFLIYPFDSNKQNNKFGKFLTTLFKDFPAFFWIKPTFKKVLAFPFIVIHALFRK